MQPVRGLDLLIFRRLFFFRVLDIFILTCLLRLVRLEPLGFHVFFRFFIAIDKFFLCVSDNVLPLNGCVLLPEAYCFFIDNDILPRVSSLCVPQEPPPVIRLYPFGARVW